MSWSADFMDALRSRRLAPVFRYQWEPVYRDPGYGTTVYSAGYAGRVSGLVNVTALGQRLQPVEWSSQLGGFTVDIVGAEACAAVLLSCTRGTVMAVYMGFEGWPESEWQRICLGSVRDIQGTQAGGPMLRVTHDDLVTSTRQRFDPDATECALFADMPASTTLSAGYTAGDSSITVASATPFNGRTNGLLRIVPSSGDPFYLRYTSRSGTAVTVATTAAYGTTAANASSGAQVYVVAWIQGHPLNIAYRILASRDGTNGVQDVLPAQWGLGITDSLIDADDVAAFQSVVWAVTSGTYEWTVYEESAVDDAYGWLTGWLGAAGGFLAMRQGRITVRCAQRPTYSCGLPIVTLPKEIRVSGDAWRYSAFSSAQRVEYCVARVLSYSSFTDSTAADAATMPVERRKDHDLSAYLDSNEADCRTSDLNRLSIYDTRIPERVEVDFLLEAGELTIGDLVDLDTTGIPTRQRVRGLDSAYQLGVVDLVTPRWTEGYVTVGILIYPPDEEVLS